MGKVTFRAVSRVGSRGLPIVEAQQAGVSPDFVLDGIVCSGRFRVELTSEEVTTRRRAERKQFKFERAQAIAAAAAEAEAAFAEGRVISTEETRTSIPSAATWKPSPSIRNAALLPEDGTDLDAEPPEDMEHMQLTLPEAFFLAWALDCLSIYYPKMVRAHHI